MFNIREMKPEDKAVIMPMVITFYHSPAVEHDVDTAVLERTFDAATDPTMPYISGLVMLEDEKVVGYGYVTGYYAYPEYKRFRIEVTESNVNAKRLYERWGFRFLEYNQMVLDR